MHILIVGARGVGKSTLIRKLLEQNKKPLFGFLTKKEQGMADPLLGDPIYIYEPGKPREHKQENLIGWCKEQRPTVRKEAFDRYAQKLKAPIDPEALILMDEIGFLEKVSPAFCEEILRLLDGDIPILAAVKDKDTDFLRTVRSHPNARCFYITEKNRDALLTEILQYMNRPYEKDHAK